MAKSTKRYAESGEDKRFYVLKVIAGAVLHCDYFQLYAQRTAQLEVHYARDKRQTLKNHLYSLHLLNGELLGVILRILIADFPR